MVVNIRKCETTKGEEMIVKLNYDPATGQISDADMSPILMWHGLKHLGETKESQDNLDKIIKLKSAGFSAQDMLALKELI